MNPKNCMLAEGLVSKSYVRQGAEAILQRENLIKVLLASRKLPADGWDDITIQRFLQDLAMMDSNNFLSGVGMGEREARCASGIVHGRHFGLAHGIGRSGNLTDEQPKAAGSTLIARLCTCLVTHALEIAGLRDVGAVSVLPMATGMTLTLALMALRKRRPAAARFVLWPRIDQKTCVKAVLLAGLQLVVVPNVMEGDQLCTDVAAIEREVDKLDPDSIVCVLSTTSCFAVRSSDKIDEIAILCQRRGIGHLVNNAYGVQSGALCRSVSKAWNKGRVDGVVQSTDKNFLVPVGGAVLAASKKDPSLVADVNSAYPGRASIAPILDLFITLLSLGVKGWQRVLKEREEAYVYLREKLQVFAESQGERLLHTPGNPISLAITLSTLDGAEGADDCNGGGGGEEEEEEETIPFSEESQESQPFPSGTLSSSDDVVLAPPDAAAGILCKDKSEQKRPSSESHHQCVGSGGRRFEAREVQGVATSLMIEEEGGESLLCDDAEEVEINNRQESSRDGADEGIRLLYDGHVQVERERVMGEVVDKERLHEQQFGRRRPVSIALDSKRERISDGSSGRNGDLAMAEAAGDDDDGKYGGSWACVCEEPGDLLKSRGGDSSDVEVEDKSNGSSKAVTGFGHVQLLNRDDRRGSSNDERAVNCKLRVFEDGMEETSMAIRCGNSDTHEPNFAAAAAAPADACADAAGVVGAAGEIRIQKDDDNGRRGPGRHASAPDRECSTEVSGTIGQRDTKALTAFGSMLFVRHISGCRIVARGECKTIGGITFKGYGASVDNYPYSYMTAAAALGVTVADVDTFVVKLSRCFAEFRKKQKTERRGPRSRSVVS